MQRSTSIDKRSEERDVMGDGRGIQEEGSSIIIHISDTPTTLREQRSINRPMNQ